MVSEDLMSVWLGVFVTSLEEVPALSVTSKNTKLKNCILLHSEHFSNKISKIWKLPMTTEHVVTETF